MFVSFQSFCESISASSLHYNHIFCLFLNFSIILMHLIKQVESVYHLKAIFAEKSVSLSWTRKILLFIFLSVCVWRDSGLRNYPICLKFCTNVYVLYEIKLYSCWCTLSKYNFYRDTQNYFNTLRPMEGNSLKSVLLWLFCITYDEIYMRFLDAQ